MQLSILKRYVNFCAENNQSHSFLWDSYFQSYFNDNSLIMVNLLPHPSLGHPAQELEMLMWGVERNKLELELQARNMQGLYTTITTLVIVWHSDTV